MANQTHIIIRSVGKGYAHNSIHIFTDHPGNFPVFMPYPYTIRAINIQGVAGNKIDIGIKGA
jgi:hypothetical protein